MKFSMPKEYARAFLKPNLLGAVVIRFPQFMEF